MNKVLRIFVHFIPFLFGSTKNKGDNQMSKVIHSEAIAQIETALKTQGIAIASRK